MSIQHIAWVLRHSKAEQGARLVLIVLAEHANDDDLAYPSNQTIAERARLSERAVRYALRRLEELEEITDEGFSRYKTTMYRIAGGNNCPPAISDTKGGQSEVSQTAPEPTPSFEPTTNPTPSEGAGGGALFDTPQLDSTLRGNAEGTVKDVWAHYQKVVPGGERYKLEAKRRTIISNALKARPLEVVLRAIDGLAASLFHNGKNDRRKTYLGIQYALAGTGSESNDERIDKMAEKAGLQSPSQSNSRPGLMSVRDFLDTLPSASRETFWIHVQNVSKMMRNPQHSTLANVGKPSVDWLANRHQVRVVLNDQGHLAGLEPITPEQS